MSEKGAWVLTSEHNDYDQHGEYFEAIWAKKPTTKELAAHFKFVGNSAGNFMDALEFILHLEGGGGRRDSEDVWYNLAFVEFGGKK